MASLDLDQADFEKQFLKQAGEYVYAGLVRLAPKVRIDIQDAVEQAVRSSPEYKSLLGGDLQKIFGIADPQPVLEAIVGGMRNGVQVSVTPPAGEILGGLKVEILREDLSDVLGVDGSSYVSYSVKRNTETVVPWLEWLLLAGDRIILTDWEVHTKEGSYVNTRTGRAVMVQPSRRGSRGFRVPPEFSGTVDSNWLTRSLEAVIAPMHGILERVVESL